MIMSAPFEMVTLLIARGIAGVQVPVVGGAPVDMDRLALTVSALERAGLAVTVLMLGMFTLAVIRRDNSVVDVAWGLSFLVIALAATTAAPQITWHLGIVVVMVSIWAMRLAWHIGRRRLNQRGEDWRYAELRKSWGAWWPVRSFVQVFVLQGLLALVASAPVFVLVAASPVAIGGWAVAGVMIWAAGFAIEVTADRQLATFLADRRAGRVDARFCTRGLWAWSRHPNYLGEAILWWGIAIVGLAVPWGWLGGIGALLVTVLVRYVSGVPILEREWRTRPGFEAWAAKTPVFLPRLW